MLTTTIPINDLSLNTTQKFSFNTSILPNNISAEIRTELSRIKSVALKVTDGNRIYYKDGTLVSFKEYTSKLCKSEIDDILTFIHSNPKSFFITEVIMYNKASYEFNGAATLSAEAQNVLSSTLHFSGQWISGTALEINSPTAVYYKSVALIQYVPILEAAKDALGNLTCPFGDRETREETMPAKDYGLNPSLVSGDPEFFGHGPKVIITFDLNISEDKRSIQAILTMDAKELGGDNTHAFGEKRETHYTAPAGFFIQSIPAEMKSYRGEDIDADADQGNDFITPSGPVHQVIYTGDMMGPDVGVPLGTGTLVKVRSINVRLSQCDQ